MDGTAFDSLTQRGRETIAAAAALCRLASVRIFQAARLHDDIWGEIAGRVRRVESAKCGAMRFDHFADAFDRLFPDKLTEMDRSARILLEEFGPRAGAMAIALTLAHVRQADCPGAQYWRDTFDAVMQMQKERGGGPSLRFD
jgi:hypothetical protein